MDKKSEIGETVNRRRFFYRAGQGLGGAALASLLRSESVVASTPPADRTVNLVAPQAGHFPPRAKNVIYLFMVGAPSQFDMIEHKPMLAKYAGQPLPESLRKFSQFAQIKEKQPKIMPSSFKFARHGKTGRYVSELLPYTARVIDDLAIIRTVKTEETVHPFAEMMFNTGYREYGKPGIGAWVTYGLGSESTDLPAYIVLQSGTRSRGKGANYTNGFLPPAYQGVPFRDAAEPVLNLHPPVGVSPEHQRDVVNTVGALNRLQYDLLRDSEIAARTASYELAFRMQRAAPELMDLRDESRSTLSMYGVDPTKASFARNCLLARRLVERGVRFVQLFHGDWDHHANLDAALPPTCGSIDQGYSALITDLKERGMLEDTLVVFAGEFGRTSVAQQVVNGNVGRDHHTAAFPVCLAGGGVAAGRDIGATDELGVYATEDPVHVHDLHATILHLLGLDHEALTYRFQGRDFRLTDVAGRVIEKVFS